MLATPSSATSSSAHRRRHSHKRSAAISGDFDLEFFKQQIPSINQQLESPIHTAPSTPVSDGNGFNRNNNYDIPSLTISESDQLDNSKDSTPRERLFTSTPSPKKSHLRLNSWAYSSSSQTNTVLKDSKPVTLNDYNSSSSNENTPDLKRQAVSIPYNNDYTASSPQYKIPEATIDLDLASCIYRDPSVPTKTNGSKNLNRHFHRRTESAPELEDFLKYKVFSKENSRKNSAIFEEVEEEEEEEQENALDNEAFDALSSSSSRISQQNPSFTSLENSTQYQSSSYSRNLQSPTSVYHSISSTPTSVKTNTTTRRGAAATRYQNYYNNNFLLSNAIKSSDSLSQVIGGTANASSLHKSSVSSLNNLRSTSTTSTASTGSTSLHSPIPQSPSRFKFESQVYDIPERSSSSTQLSSSKPKSNISSPSTISKSHKKSNSLLKSISAKIRRNSTSSTKSFTPDQSSNSTPQKQKVQIQLPDRREFSPNNYNEGDSTLTPLDFGEPGPELDLITMTPKYHHKNHKNNEQQQQQPHIMNSSDDLLSPSINQKNSKRSETIKDSPKKSKMNFFGWRKK